jgi:type IX secretion system PorP/SprF family membrane protein
VKKHLYTILSIWVAVLCLPILVMSQDIHYTNIGYSPLNLNPALVGSFNGDSRFNGSFRSQWTNVPVSYVTFSGSYDMRLGDILKNVNRPWSIGALFNYDIAGWSNLNNINFNLLGSYGIPVGKGHRINIGALGGFNQRRFSTSELTFDDQYIDRRFNSNVTSRDAGIFDRSHNYFDVSTGINYHYQKPNKRSAVDIGYGFHHLNKPKKSFQDQQAVKLEPRNSLYFMTNVQASRFFDILLDAYGQWQGPHRELLAGLGGRLYLVDRKTKLLALQAGVYLRGADAYSPWVGLLYNRWRVAVNFDANYSPFTAATNRFGGPEVHVTYIFAKVPPANYCPFCPTFL